jgi:hypothetical protein
MIDEATSLRREAAELLRSIHVLVGIAAPLLFALGTLTFVNGLEWAATTGPVIFAALSLYLIDIFVEAAYLGGNRALIERRVSEMLNAAPGKWSVADGVWDTPMVWETRIVPDRLRSPSRLGMGALWVALYGISLGFAINSIADANWSTAVIVLYFLGILALTSTMAAAMLRLNSAHERAELLAAREPVEGSGALRKSGKRPFRGLFG